MTYCIASSVVDNKISVLMKKKEAQNNQIKNLKKRILDIETEIGRISKNADLLIEERNKLLASEKKENTVLSSVMYINTIQQNIAHSNDLKNEISNNVIILNRSIRISVPENQLGLNTKLAIIPLKLELSFINFMVLNSRIMSHIVYI